MGWLSDRRRRSSLFKVGDYLEHKNDPDVHGTVVEVSDDKVRYTLRLSDGRMREDVGEWVLRKTSPLDAMARAANQNFRGPGA